ncbi:hypothetical protein BOSEA31B_11446 [Hyphomicrobiales bacterium]|nr:hypothetical protein BOSEA31B_11446 [Hyphomicrobiales bacterium]CAH1697241.1 hypothetical protein BOSEA1005_10278 [Hyphomicrobiales bacterium]CAI0342809.1 hypothetical protein BO1005MUT1_10102 [Hyphomicrobiales bacterium]
MPKDSLKDRLNAEIRFVKRLSAGEFSMLGELGLSTEERKSRRAAEALERKKALSTPLGRSTIAAVETTFSAHTDYDGSLSAAFKEFGLDPHDPRSWAMMLRCFARAHFGPRKAGGRPREWNGARYWQLIRDVAEKQRGNANLSKEDAYRALSKDKRYQGISAVGIKRAYLKATDPRANDDLKSVMDMLLAEFGEEAAKEAVEELGYSEELAAAYAQNEMLESAIRYYQENDVQR